MKKILAALLLVSLILTFTACSDGNDENNESSKATENTSSSTVSVDEKTYKDEDGKYISSLTTRDWGNIPFTVIVVSDKAGGTYKSIDYHYDPELQGDVINDAVHERNSKIEEKYNVKIVEIRSDNPYTDVYNDCMGATELYDIAMPYVGNLLSLAQDNKLYDLTKLENIDLDAPWWSKQAEEAFSVGGHLYFQTGDATLLDNICSPSILFNKTVAANNQIENLYEAVENKVWTFDKMYSLAKEVTVENGDGTWDENDQWGMSTCYADSYSFFAASGESICKKNADDEPYFTINSERSLTVAQTILARLQESGWCLHHDDIVDPDWSIALGVLSENRCLFRPSAFSAVKKLRNSDCEFGILPQPLWDTDQDEYYSNVGIVCVSGVGIPLTVRDVDFSSYMLEVLTAESKNTMAPAYYELSLKWRDTRDDDSQRMLDLIFDNIVYDVGEVYDFGGARTMFSTLMSQKSTNVASYVDSIQDAVEADIQKVIDQYELVNANA